MYITAAHLRGFQQELLKVGNVLTESNRAEIAPKNFALSAKQSDTGKPAYPIEDKGHASNALARVKQFGDAKEKAEVYKDVARKYPGLAAKSSVGALRSKEKDSNMEGGGGPESYNAAKLPKSFQAPEVGGSMKMGSRNSWVEVFKEAGVAGALSKIVGPKSKQLGNHLNKYQHHYDLAGLGVLAAPSAHNLAEQAHTKATGGPVDKKEVGHSLAEIGGLGILAAPVAASLSKRH